MTEQARPDPISLIGIQLGKLEEITEFLLDHPGAQIYHRKWRKEQPFCDALSEIKKLLLAARRCAASDEEFSRVEMMQAVVRDLAGNVRIPKEHVAQRVAALRRLCMQLRPAGERPPSSFALDTSGVPPEIREEMLADIQELEVCAEHGANRSALFLCGRILELALGRKFWEETQVDPVVREWTLGKLITECEARGILKGLPKLFSLAKIIKDCRNPSVHVTARVYRPTPGEVGGLSQVAASVVQRLYPPAAI